MNLLIREKVIDFFIITFSSFITFILSLLSYLSYLSRLLSPRYNKACDKAYAKACVKVYKTYDNICDKYYCYNKMKFNNINKFNIRGFFLPLLSLLFYLF